MAKVTQAHVEARTAAILQAARTVFGLKGIEPRAATLDDVAAEAGISKGAIYGYFANKAELLAAIQDRAGQEDRALLDRVGRSSASAWATFVALGRAIWEWIADPAHRPDNLLTFEVMLASARYPETYGSRSRDNAEHVIAQIEPLLRQAQADGDLAADLDPHLLAVLSYACTEGSRAYLVRTGDHESVCAAYDLFCDLLARTAPSHTASSATPPQA
jgi:AcrR family transcriptional regulator